MKKLFIGALAAFLLSVAPSAFADNLYARVSVGQATDVSVGGINLGDSFTYAGDVGGQVGPVRVEFGAARLALSFYGINATAIDYRATALYDVRLSDRSTLFVGAGPDYIQADVHYGPYSQGTNGTGWHVTGGLAHRVSDHFIAEVSVNHVEADIDANATANIFSVGGRVPL